ncbi:MAG TPA: hypothetical protein VL309_02720 [Vicinamibacterales bacterium]|nr:hypothetical protein [Vicinamibacterales bacterium]
MPLPIVRDWPGRVRAAWPLAAAMAAFLALVGALLVLSLRHTGGHVIYALDDPYIHMAMAKHVALDGTWGVSPDRFSSSSSSLLWTALLAALFAVGGVHDGIPLLMNVAAGLALLWIVARRLRPTPAGRHPVYLWLVLTAIVLATPMPALVFVGQEHLLHACVAVLFLDLGAGWLAPVGASAARGAMFARLAALAAVLPLVRYEALFLVALVALATLARGWWREAGILGASAAVPVLLYGAFSAWHGWYWLPNSVLVKGARPGFATVHEAIRSLGYVAYSRLTSLPAIGFLVTLVVVFGAMRIARATFDGSFRRLALFAALALAHLQYAQPAAFWMFRYEAYLVAVGLFVLANPLLELATSLTPGPWPRMRQWALGALAALLVVSSPLPDRAARSFAIVPRATANIYEQQYQMGLFLARYYERAPVALNDIGAASYLSDIDCLDLVGLADMTVARRVLNGWFAYDDIEEIAAERGIRIAIVFDSWFHGRIPPRWQKAGSWTIDDNAVEGDDTVTFYAVRPEELGPLRSRLREFAASLPDDVSVDRR